jgi:hypothetical protein
MVALFLAENAVAQRPGLGTWSVLNVEVNFDDKWGAFYEGQLRSQKFFDDFYYHENKGGISYKAAKQATLLVGIGQYATYGYDDNFESPVTHEFRLWEQLTLTNNIGRFKLEHRYRVEQRFYDDGNYRNRFRYRLNALLPLNKEIIGKGAFYLNAFEEVFLTNEGPYFQRNRASAGIGYGFSNTFTLQFAYINQFEFQSNLSHFTKHFFQTSLLVDINRGKTSAERYPRIVD